MSFRRIFFTILLCLLLFLSFVYIFLWKPPLSRGGAEGGGVRASAQPNQEISQVSPLLASAKLTSEDGSKGDQGGLKPTPTLLEVPPVKGESPATGGEGGSTPLPITHTVLPGDTLESIALAYNVSWIDLASYNKIENPNFLSIGQEITIPPLPKGGEEGLNIDPYYKTQIPALLASRSGSREGAGEGFKRIFIVLSEQKLYTYEGETKIGEYLISSGVAAHPTVTGEFKIWIKLESTLMSGEDYYLPDVPYTMYFYGDYGIHGTYWHSNFGTPMSHGCINMKTEEAKIVFEWAEVGTIVDIVP